MEADCFSRRYSKEIERDGEGQKEKRQERALTFCNVFPFKKYGKFTFYSDNYVLNYFVA